MNAHAASLAQRRARLLLVGGAPKRLTECAVLWRDYACELVPTRFARLVHTQDDLGDGSFKLNRTEIEAFAERALEFDVVWCETPEAVVLEAELARRGERGPGILAMEVDGLGRAPALRRAYDEDPWPRLAASPRVRFLAASDVQHRGLVASGVDPAHIDRLDAAAFVYQLMIPDADERLRRGFALDAELAPEVPPGAVLVAGLGRRDTSTWIEAAALLPDVPFVSVGPPVECALANVRAIAPIPLEAFIAAIRRSRLCVVCLQPGDGDGGHTTACIAQALGVPVIASRVPGVMDYVVDGVSARVVPPSDPRALATAIRWLWEDAKTRARLVEGGLSAEASRVAISERGLLDALARLRAAR